jgi:hypothetical protein
LIYFNNGIICHTCIIPQVRTNELGVNETLTFNLPYEERYNVLDYCEKFATKYNLNEVALSNKVNSELIHIAATDFPNGDTDISISSSEASMSLLNAYRLPPLDRNNRWGDTKNEVSDSLDIPIYFIGYDSVLTRKNSNPHIDRLYLTEEAQKRSELEEAQQRSENRNEVSDVPISHKPTIRPSVVPAFIRGKVTDTIIL